MVNGQSSRVDDALTSLVKLYIPINRDEDEGVANERREDVHAALQRIIEGSVVKLEQVVPAHQFGRYDQVTVPQDIDHTSDLIKETRT